MMSDFLKDFFLRERSMLLHLTLGKVKKILKGSLDSISSPLPSVKIQIMAGKVCLRLKGKTLLGVVNKLVVHCRNVLPLHLNPAFLPIIWIFTEVEGDGIKSRLPFKIFSTLVINLAVHSSFLGTITHLHFF